MTSYKAKRSYKFVKILGGLLVGSLMISLVACAQSAVPAAPIAPAAPAAPAAPVAASAAPVVIIAGAPTAIPARATATRVLPTATSVVKTSGPRKGGQIVVTRDYPGWTMDPTFSFEWASLFWMYGVYSGLIRNNVNNEIVPDIAESWDVSNDGKTITFNLRKDAKFTDGAPVNADAVKWTIDRYMSPDLIEPQGLPSRRNKQLSEVESFDKIDDYTVSFTLKRPFRPFLANLTQRPGMILNPAAIQADPYGSEASGAVGSGPFKITRWRPEASLVLSANPTHYNPDAPYVDSIKVYHSADQTVRLAMIRTGDVDFAESIRGLDVSLVDKTGLVLEENSGGRVEVMIVHTWAAPPFDNRNFRRAMALSLDRETMVDVLWEGRANPAYIPTGPAYGVYHNPDLQPLKYDLEKAKAELAKAGYPNGVDIPLPCAGTTAKLTHCAVLQDLWAAAGIRATIEPKIPSGHWGHWTQGQFPFIISWRAARPDPHINIQRVFHSEGFSNPMKYSNATVDALIDQAGAEYDTAKAKALYDEIQDIVVNDAVEIYQVNPSEYHVRKDKIKGYGYYLNAAFRFRDWWIEE